MNATTAPLRRWSATRSSTRAATVFGVGALLLVFGWAIGAEHTKALLLILAIAGVAVLTLKQRGALVAILLLAGMDGIPFFNTERLVTGKLAVTDIAVITLLFIGVIWILLDGGPRAPTTAARAISRIGVLLALWWAYVMARTLIEQNVPLLRAAYFGRDFILFALLLVVLPRVRVAERDIAVFLGILAVGVCLFAVGQIMTATGIGQPGGLIHFHYTLTESGLTRVYSSMTDLVTASLAASIAAGLLARQRRLRLISLPIMVLLLVSTIVQLTRARWIGLIIGVVLVSLWLVVGSSFSTGSTLRRRLSFVLVSFALLLVVAIVVVPSLISGGEVVNRVTSIFSDLQSGSGTVAIREAVTHTMKVVLGEQWPFGLGFIPPFSHYYLGLPGGSIRDPDLGVLNAVMTMGVLGAVLIYLPVLIVLFECLRRLSRSTISDYSWLLYGGAIWLVATLASSVTLVTLFSTSGLALAAVMLAILTRVEPLSRSAVVPSAAASADRRT